MQLHSLSYRITGQGKPLLMIHGFGLTYNIWKKLAPLLLSAGRQLIMVELPGIGASPLPETDKPYNQVCAKRLLALRQELDITKWDVLGYSCGARTADAYIASDVTGVDRVVYICPLQMRLDQWLGLSAVSWLDYQYPILGNWVLSGSRFDVLLQLLSFSGRRPPELLEWHAEITAQYPEILKTTLRMLLLYRLQPLRASGRPVQRIWGRSDLLARPPLWPRPEDAIITGDHALPVLESAAVGKVVLEFLAS